MSCLQCHRGARDRGVREGIREASAPSRGGKGPHQLPPAGLFSPGSLLWS